MTAQASLTGRRRLLACGVAVAPTFYTLVAIQLALAPDFELRTLPVSYLALEEAGWIQVLDFIVTGGLAVACGLGLAGAAGGRVSLWAGILVGLYGIGMAGAGLFPADPPPVAGSAVEPSLAGGLHMTSFFLAFVSLAAACFVLAVRFIRAGRRGWAIYSALTGIAAPVLIVGSVAAPAWAGLIVGAAGVILFGWLSLSAWRWRADDDERRTLAVHSL